MEQGPERPIFVLEGEIRLVPEDVDTGVGRPLEVLLHDLDDIRLSPLDFEDDHAAPGQTDEVVRRQAQAQQWNERCKRGITTPYAHVESVSPSSRTAANARRRLGLCSES